MKRLHQLAQSSFPRVAIFLALAALVPACGPGPGRLIIPAIFHISPGSLPSGVVGTAYSQTLTAVNGTGPFTWTLLSGTPPPGIVLTSSATTATIAGTPTGSANVASFTVRVTDATSHTADQFFQIVITQTGPPNPIGVSSPGALPAGTQNAFYSTGLAATGGTPPYVWTLTGASLPTGLSLSPSGVISGVPSVAGGPTSFQVTVTDSLGAGAFKTVSITINAALSIPAAALPASTVGVVYTQPLTANGGTLPLVWSLISGALPGGLSLSAGGTISGTIGAPAGDFGFTVQVADSASAVATQAFTIHVNPVITVTTPSLPPDTVGVAYSPLALTAVGGTAPYVSWAITSGTIPTGMNFNTVTGVISGTPTAPSAPLLTFQVTDSVGAVGSTSLTLTVNDVPGVTTVSVPNWTINRPYSKQLTAINGTGALTWSFTGGPLPVGITLSPSGLLSGTPTTPGISAFSVKVTDTLGAVSVAQPLSITINAAPTISAAALPADTINHLYPTQTLTPNFGTTPYASWTLSVGTLPAGLSLNSPAGTISGTPTAAGSFPFTVKLTDAAGATATQNFSITVNALPTVTASVLPGGTQGTAYAPPALQATGGTGALTWSLASGTPPTGLTLNTDGTITGTPSGTGTSLFNVQVTDTLGVVSASQGFSITITGSAPTITTTLIPDGVINSLR